MDIIVLHEIEKYFKLTGKFNDRTETTEFNECMKQNASKPELLIRMPSHTHVICIQISSQQC